GLLNTVEPTPEAPSHRAPDLLVLLGTSRLKAEFDQIDLVKSRPHLLWSALQALRGSQQLIGPFDSGFRPSLGRTRVILLPEAPRPRTTTRSFHVPEGAEGRALRALAKFRSGFTITMAVRMLRSLDPGTLDAPVDEVLERLTTRQLVRRVGGGLFIPDRVR